MRRLVIQLGSPRWALAALLGLALSSAAGPGKPAAAPRAAPQAQLVALRVDGDDANAVIEVLADRPLSFTTLRLQEPPRVVLDFADTGIRGVLAEQRINDGTVRRVGATLVGKHLARVVIELQGDAEFDVRAAGRKLEVRVARLVPRTRPLLASARPVAGASAVPDPKPAPAPAPAPDVAAPVEPPPPPARAAAPVAVAQPEVQPPPAGPEAPAPEPELAVQAAPKAAPEPALAAPEAEKPAQEPQVAVAAVQVAEPEPKVAVSEPKVAEAAPKVVVPEPKVAEAAPEIVAPEPKVAEAAPKIVAPEPKVAEAAPKIAVPEPTVAEVVEQERPPAVETEEEKAASLPTIALAPSRKSNLRALASAAPPPPRSPPASGPPQGGALRRDDRLSSRSPSRPAARKTAVTGIGFRPFGGGAVLVHSDRPVDFELASESLVVVVHLRNAEITNSNNRRLLDTRVFGGPVARVVPASVPGGTDLRIELQRRASHRVEQTAGLLTVTFAAE